MSEFVESRAGSQFLATLRRAADECYAAGEISRREHRQVTIACILRPRKMREVAQFIAERAELAGVIPPGAAGNLMNIQWDKEEMLDFIRQIFQMILEFLQALLLIFGGL